MSHKAKLDALHQLGLRLQQDTLYEYRTALATKLEDLPVVKDVEYDITLKPGTQPKRQRQYKYPTHLRKVIRDQLQEWQKVGIAEEEDATWIHPIVLVRKKPTNGQGERSTSVQDVFRPESDK